MIVQCTQCRSRFRVADERVPDRGVKVRCTKCSNVFRVTKADAVDPRAPAEAAPAASPAPPPAAADMAVALPGPSAPSPTKGASLSPRPSPLQPPVSFTYGAASPNLSLDFDLAPPAPPPAAIAAPPPRPVPGAANPIMSAIDAALGAAIASQDPFSAEENTQDPFGSGSLPGLPPINGQQPPPEEEPVPQGPSSIDLFGDKAASDRLAAAALDFGLPPAPEAPRAAPPPAPIPTPSPRGAAAYDSFFDLAAPKDEPPPAPAPAARPAPSFEESDPFAGLDTGGPAMAPAPMAAPEPPAPTPRERTQTPTTAAAARDAPPTAAEPGFVPSSAREIDLPEPTQDQKLDLLGDGGKIEFARIAPIKGMVLPELQKPLKIDPKAATKARLRREFASAILNVASAALVCYAGIVAIAVVRTPRPIGWQDLGFSMVWLAFGAESVGHSDSVRTHNVHSGVYQTNTGEELFYVQGQVENDSSRRHEAMYVTLELRRGAKVIDHADALVGLRAAPEDLYDLVSRKNEDLQSLLSKRTPPAPLEPHKSAGFVGVFDLTARDLAGAEVHIEVHDGVPPSMKAGAPKKADAAPPPAPAAPESAEKPGKPVETARTP